MMIGRPIESRRTDQQQKLVEEGLGKSVAVIVHAVETEKKIDSSGAVEKGINLFRLLSNWKDYPEKIPFFMGLIFYHKI